MPPEPAMPLCAADVIADSLVAVNPITLTLTLTPDDADAIYRTVMGHHVRELEVHKTRVFAERLRQFVVERMNDPEPYDATFNHASELLSAAEVRRFLDDGESYRSVVKQGARSA